MMKFACPNGHPLSCSEDRAGKPAQCPECKVRFLVPDVEEAETSGSGAHSTRRQPQNVIVFLCPNGHRLNGPASLAGQPGQCPHCGAKFRIPSDEDEEDDIEDDELASTTSIDDFGDLNLADVDDLEVIEDEDAEELDVYGDTDISAGAGELPPAPLAASGRHSLAPLFTRLWQERRGGVEIELQLKSGERLTPDKFGLVASQQHTGIFAVKEPDGAYTIHAVPWESIAQVVTRKVKKLPGDLFD